MIGVKRVLKDISDGSCLRRHEWSLIDGSDGSLQKMESCGEFRKTQKLIEFRKTKTFGVFRIPHT